MKYQCKSEMPLKGGLEIASLFSEGAQLHSAPCPIEIMMCHPCKNKTSGWTSVSLSVSKTLIVPVNQPKFQSDNW